MRIGGLGRSRDCGGAAAVEFALIMPVLFLLLFGIIDYGMWFADSITVRQAAREAARDGVVQEWGAPCDGAPLAPAGSGSPSADLQQLACQTVRSTATMSGPLAVKMKILGTSGRPGWVVGNTLRVCVAQKHSGWLPLVPLPSSAIRARTDMAIETATGTPPESGGEGTDPSGDGWSWC